MTKTSKIMTAEEVAARIADGATVVTTAEASFVVADHLLSAVESRFKAEGHPRNITFLIPCNGQVGPGTGVDRVGYSGLLKRYIASAFPLQRGAKVSQMIMSGEVEAYNFPMGVLYGLLREIGAGRPGVLTHVGLDTYVDPLHGGGKMTPRTTEDLVERLTLGGKTLLFYRAFPVDVALIKATTADTSGNLTMEREPLTLGSLTLAIATKASGGKVYAQVERIAERHSLPTRSVVVPENLVDGIVLAPDAPQSDVGHYDPTITGEFKAQLEPKQVDQGTSRVVAARAAGELRQGWLINLGVGIPTDVPTLVWEAGLQDMISISTEHGGINGYPNPLPLFGAHSNADAILDPPNVFDMYSGGLLDATFLGLAQADAEGNVNVSRFGGLLFGCGGFIDITARTKRIFICGTLAASGAKVSVGDGRIHIDQEGKVRKLIKRVEHLTLNGRAALAKGQEVTMVTERGLFRLTQEGWLLTEVAPGIDPERHIAPMIEFPLRKAENLEVYAPEVLAGPGPSFGRWLEKQMTRSSSDDA